MNSTLSNFPGDWLAATSRWLFMALLPIIAGLRGALDRHVVGVLAGWIAFSLIVSLLRLASWRIAMLDIVSAAVDTLLGLGLIGLTGWHVSPFWWSLLMPAAQISLQRGLRSGGMTLLGALVSASLLSMGVHRFSLWVLAQSLLQAAGVALGAFILSLPARRLLFGVQAWGNQRQESAQRELVQERRKAGQLSLLSAEINAALEAPQIASRGLALCGQLLDEAQQSEGFHTGAVYLRQGDELVHAASSMAIPAEQTEAPINRADVSAPVPSILFEDQIDKLFASLLLPPEDWCECILAPLTAGSLEMGLMVIGHPAPAWFGQEELEWVDAVSRQMGVALNNARLYAEITAERDRISEIQEEVRKKLARDLHDGPTQVVAAIAMRVNFARRLLSRDREKAATELLKVEQMARRTTKEIRHMLFTLRPLILESQGLVAALNQLVNKTIETHNQLVYLEMDPDLNNNLGLERESVLFFIAEEAINNARKHAAAAHIWVRLMQEGDWFVLEVEDDGAGFNVGEVDRDYEQRGSLGMVNMRERAELVNGDLHIESTEGVGTLVRLKVPLVDPDHEAAHFNSGSYPGNEVDSP
jgi:signal transduction histidine kinase